MGEVPCRAALAATPASARTRSALTRPPRPPSHAAPRTPAISAPSAAAFDKSSTVSFPASATVSPASCARSTHRRSASSLTKPKRPRPFLSLVSSNTPWARFRVATSITCSQHRSANAARTIAQPGTDRGRVSLANARRGKSPGVSSSAALTGRRPATRATIAASASGATGPSGPREGSLASMISAPPSIAAVASAASATLTRSFIVVYVNLCR